MRLPAPGAMRPDARGRVTTHWSQTRQLERHHPVKRIDRRIVELTPAEQEVKDAFDRLLDEGWGVPQAAVAALGDHWLFGRPPAWGDRTARRAFVAWLSDDSVAVLSKGGYVIKVGFREGV